MDVGNSNFLTRAVRHFETLSKHHHLFFFFAASPFLGYAAGTLNQAYAPRSGRCGRCGRIKKKKGTSFEFPWPQRRRRAGLRRHFALSFPFYFRNRRNRVTRSEGKKSRRVRGGGGGWAGKDNGQGYEQPARWRIQPRVHLGGMASHRTMGESGHDGDHDDHHDAHDTAMMPPRPVFRSASEGLLVADDRCKKKKKKKKRERERDELA
ncbi:hypothetical protein B0J12DRAFT_298827 [Macrophomina phaseolina]|uniref:Uncharacterized protein n=1 Tax=Macrophomina phaseolina TaxID=35725 RepID=A0ABQ8GRR4_9PEZI|nr:hypothetical protein B0J12DRAFT_298827 [Macrophomina phaseolina]